MVVVAMGTLGLPSGARTVLALPTGESAEAVRAQHQAADPSVGPMAVRPIPARSVPALPLPSRDAVRHRGNIEAPPCTRAASREHPERRARGPGPRAVRQRGRPPPQAPHGYAVMPAQVGEGGGAAEGAADRLITPLGAARARPGWRVVHQRSACARKISVGIHTLPAPPKRAHA